VLALLLALLSLFGDERVACALQVRRCGRIFDVLEAHWLMPVQDRLVLE
jgi:hypothetical protein